jgi:hypothetical protein
VGTEDPDVEAGLDDGRRDRSEREPVNQPISQQHGNRSTTETGVKEGHD